VDTIPNHAGLIGGSSATTDSSYMQGFGLSNTSYVDTRHNKEVHIMKQSNTVVLHALLHYT